MRSTAAALAVGVSLLAVTGSPAETPQMEVVGVSSDRQGPAEPNPQEPPEPNLPGPLAPLVGKDGRPVLDEDGNQVMIPVTPPDGAVAVLPPGSTRRMVTFPDDSVGEQVTIVPN